MKKFLIIILLYINLFADIIIKNSITVDNYKDLQFAVNNMPSNSMIIINNDLNFSKILDINNKKNLILFFNNNFSIFRKGFIKGNIKINNSVNIMIYGNDHFFGDINFSINNSQNINFESFYIKNLNNFHINIKNNSQVAIGWLNLYCKKEKCANESSYIGNLTSQNFKPYITVDSSILNIYNTNLKGYHILNAKNSYLKLDNIWMGNDIYPTNYNSPITIDNSKFIINKLILDNKYLFDDKSYGLQITNSTGIIKNSIINNIWTGILISNSKVILQKNQFKNNYVSIVTSENSQGVIQNNEFITDKEHDYIDSTAIQSKKKSLFNILNNSIDRYKWGIVLFDSKTNIMDSEFSNIKNHSIELQQNSIANLLNNITTSSKYKLVYWIDETSLAFIKDNVGEFYTKSENAFLPKMYNIKVTPPKIDFNNKFEFKNFKLAKDLKKFTINKLKKSNLIKGVLQEDIIVTLPNGDEDEVPQGTYVEIETKNSKYGKSFFIVKPEEYKGCELDEIPALKKDNEFKLESYSEKIGKKIRFYFTITTDKNIKSISFKNDRPLTLIKKNDYYQTKPRRKIFKNKQNILIINFDDGMIKTFNCVIDINSTLQCNPIKKINF